MVRALEGILPTLACPQEHFGNARFGIDDGQPFEVGLGHDDLVIETAGDKVEFCSMPFPDLNEDPMNSTSRRCPLTMPNRLALACLRADARVRPHRTIIRF